MTLLILRRTEFDQELSTKWIKLFRQCGIISKAIADKNVIVVETLLMLPVPDVVLFYDVFKLFKKQCNKQF